MDEISESGHVGGMEEIRESARIGGMDESALRTLAPLTSTRNRNTHVLPNDSYLNATLCIKVGVPYSSCRKKVGEDISLEFKVCEGFDVLRSKLQVHINAIQDAYYSRDDGILFKPSNNASQKAFVLLNDANFITSLTQRWRLIQESSINGFVFEFFHYVKPIQAANANQIHRATASRRTAAAIEIAAHVQANPGIILGPISRAHLEVTRARQDSSQLLTIPSDNTFFQAQMLDTMQSDTAEAPTNNLREIKVHLGGMLVPLMVDVQSLRLALGLPQHELFRDGIFHPPTETNVTNPDMEDEDHL
jgi:hypothetical protein